MPHQVLIQRQEAYTIEQAERSFLLQMRRVFEVTAAQALETRRAALREIGRIDKRLKDLDEHAA